MPRVLAMAKARLNLEVELWTDPRFQKLMIELGDRFQATGAVVQMWVLAQQYWCDGRKSIPQSAWEAGEFPEALIRCGLAERREDGIYAKGAEGRFQWWFEGIEQRRKAGEESVRKRRTRYGTAVPFNASNGSRRISNETEREPNGAEPSSSPSASKEEGTTTTVPKPSAAKDQVYAAYAVWCDTLAAFEIPRTSMAPVQESSIARSIAQLGFENVCLALEGQRYEKGKDGFEPRRYLSIDRVLHRDAKGKSRWEEFKNMALAARERSEIDEKARRDAEGVA